MSTRSITTIKSKWGDQEWKTHAHIYRHHDGYILDGHGEYLADFLKGLKVTNGREVSRTDARRPNGPCELAGELVHQMCYDGHNPGLGSFDALDRGQDFHYVILVDYNETGGEIAVQVFDGPIGDSKLLFYGDVEEYREFVRQYAAEE